MPTLTNDCNSFECYVCHSKYSNNASVNSPDKAQMEEIIRYEI